MKWKRAVCGAVLAGLMLTPAYAAQFTDTTAHWAEASIERWSSYGVISGYGDGTFGPNNQITRAEMAAILSQIFGWQEEAENTFTDVSGGEWYAQSLLRAKAAGVMAGYEDGTIRPNSLITRQEVAVMISSALRVSGSGSGRDFGDYDQIGAWAAAAVNGMSQRGFISGAADGNFYPLKSITRAETVTILNQAIANYYNRAGNYSASTAGITVVAAPGVTLQNMTVDGDLFIAPGANDSEVILKNVTVTGQTYIQSGRGAQVIVSGSHLEQLSVEGGGARVTLQGENDLTQLVVSGDQASVRGLEENQQVVVAPGTSGAVINGHSAAPGTVTAGKDVSTDDDDVIVEIEITGGTTDSGSTSGGTTNGTANGGTSGGTTSGGTTSGGTTDSGTTDGGTTSGGTTSGGTTDSGTTNGGTTNGGTTDGGTTNGGTTSGSDETRPPKSDTDENGTITIDFGDLLKP